MYEVLGEMTGTDHCLVVAKVRERLAVSKQAAQKLDGERFNLRKPHELEVRKEYQIEISNRFAALENLSDSEDTNRAGENFNIKTSAKKSLGLHKLKQHKPWLDEECLHFLDQRRQAKMQWVQDPCLSSVDKLNNVRREASRYTYFRNIKKAYLKAKIEELETNSKIKNIRDLYRGINNIKRQPRTNIVKNEKGDLVADSHSILACFSQLLNVHGVNEVRQTEIYTAELVPKPSAFDVELVIERLKSHKSPGIDQIPAKLIKAGGKTIHFEIHK